ncbi:hypothetical protein dqs_0689 [Azoarcus olearius]|nr:hypothetical protein [Azoarcus olearius]ANQ83764.1 hypothetical protein dqs_0689 [Azoarcus olearius]
MLSGSAWAELVLVAARSGPIPALSREEAEQLYLGRRTTLADGTPVSLVDLPAGAARDSFYQELTGKNPSQTRAYWSRLVFTGRALPPREAATVAEARDWIATRPGTIGYLPVGSPDDRLRVLLRLP